MVKNQKIKGRNSETQKWIICRCILVHRCLCSCTTVPLGLTLLSSGCIGTGPLILQACC